MRAPPSGFDRMAPDNVSRLMLYLASPNCRFTGRIFGVDGDDIDLFEGMGAETHASNHGSTMPYTTSSKELSSETGPDDRADSPCAHQRAIPDSAR